VSQKPPDDGRPAFFDEGFEECDEIDETWVPSELPPMSAEEIARGEEFAESAERIRAEVERALAEEQAQHDQDGRR
jgi:hypothetical protein